MIINEPGTYTLKYTAEDSCGNKTEETRNLVVAQASQVFGAEWDGSDASTWTRTDASAQFANPVAAVNNGNGSSPFDDIMPWSGMSIVEDANAGTLVSIPKYWYKWTRDGAKMKLQIANGAQEGFFVSPAHADRGDGNGERDVVYVGRYHCGSTYKSAAGVTPKASETRSSFRTNIHNLGTDIWQYDFAMYWTIAMLYLVEYADWDSQGTIGYGCSQNGSVFNMGATDGMTYHTGTSAATRQTYGSVQYRHIEGLWDNVYDWCDGIYFSDTNVYTIKNPADFNDTTGGTLVGTRANASGVPQTFTEPTAAGYEYALYPATASGSNYVTRTCDRCNFYSSGVVLCVGGNYNQNQNYGLFYLNGNNGVSNTNGNIGSRHH